MNFSPRAIRWCGLWESLFLKAYDDATEKVVPIGGHCSGVLTIGIGHTSAAGPPHVYIGQEITEDEAHAILAADLVPVVQEVAHYIHVPLSQQQFDAVGMFQYNTGWLGHPHCSLVSALNAGNYTLADADFALYNRASGRVMRGLVRRRQSEADMFAKGLYNGP